MKKIISMMILFIGCIVCGYGQIFTTTFTVDKFNDVISERRVKTLVSYTDSSVVVEEKGKTAEEYIIMCEVSEECVGSKDNVIELVDGVYGFQMTYFAIKVSDAAKFRLKYAGKTYSTDEERMNFCYEAIEKCGYRIVDRHVSHTRYSYEFEREYFWIENIKGERTIYLRP